MIDIEAALLSSHCTAVKRFQEQEQKKRESRKLFADAVKVAHVKGERKIMVQILHLQREMKSERTSYKITGLL